MIEGLVIVCVTFSTGYFSWIPKQDFYLTRSESQCANYARVERKTMSFNAWPYTLPRDQNDVERRCGPNLIDCKDVRDWSLK